MKSLRVLTPPGRAAIAVLGVGEAERAEAARRLGLARMPARGAFRLVRVELGGASERALCLSPPEGGLEFHLHGNPLLVDRCVEILGGAVASDPRPATLEAEILAEAAGAPSREGVLACLAQRRPEARPGGAGAGDSSGPTGAGLCCLARALVAVRAGTRARLEGRFGRALEAGRRLAPWLRPPRVVLRGPVNAGKSTLFNVCAGGERVRSGPEPALTRDPVSELVFLDGQPFVLVDTAGEAEAREGLDAEAAELGRASAAGADLCLWLQRSEDPRPLPRPRAGLVVLRTGPRAGRAEPGVLTVDLRKTGAPELREALARELREALGGTPAPRPGEAAWLNARQRLLCERARRALGEERLDEAASAGAALLCWRPADARSEARSRLDRRPLE